jgi:hypothetical protein
MTLFNLVPTPEVSKLLTKGCMTDAKRKKKLWEIICKDERHWTVLLSNQGQTILKVYPKMLLEMPSDSIFGREVQDNYMKEISVWEELSIANFQKVFANGVVAESNRLLVLSELKRVLGLGLRRGSSYFGEEESQEVLIPGVASASTARAPRAPRTPGRPKGSARGSKKKEDLPGSQTVETATPRKDLLTSIYEKKWRSIVIFSD